MKLDEEGVACNQELGGQCFAARIQGLLRLVQ